MYGLPRGFDASRLVGRTLDFVTFTSNTVHFSFDGGASITIEASFTHWIRGAAPSSQRLSVPVSESRLMQVVGAAVSAARATEDGTLVLDFTNGQSIAVHDDSPRYESYRMQLGDEEIIV